ncbi:hypothetical protein C8R47DRAFT_1065320 [Mycena vitilis]|nr:hypothetical protein C8R47DRAFT_1065320 [Mycena vitilis]
MDLRVEIASSEKIRQREKRREFWFQEPVPAEDQLSIPQLVDIFSTYAPTARRLRIRSENVSTLTTLTAAINGVDLPNLHSVVLRSKQSWRFDTHTSPIHQPSPTAFINSVRGPSVVHFSGFSLAWSSPHYYSNVTTMVLEHLAAEVAPDIRTFHAAVRCMQRLARLSVNFMTFTGSVVDLPPITLHNLEFLHVGLAGSTHTANILSLMRAPELSTFHLGLYKRSDIDLLQCCAALLAPVESLTIDEGHGRVTWAEKLHGLMPNLKTLDLTWSSNLFFFAMLKDFTQFPGIWPHLKTFLIKEAYFEELERLVESRKGQCPVLNEIRVHYEDSPIEELTDTEMDWLEARVRILRIDVDIILPWYNSW